MDSKKVSRKMISCLGMLLITMVIPISCTRQSQSYKFMPYQNFVHQLGCSFSIVPFVHNVLECASYCDESADCVAFSTNQSFGCVLCGKEQYASLEIEETYGITGTTNIFGRPRADSEDTLECKHDGKYIEEPFPYCSCPNQLYGKTCDKGIIPISEPQAAYSYTFAEGKAHCENNDMQIATLAQLEQGLLQGYQYCVCGWLADGTARYPMQISHPDCGGYGPAIHNCGAMSRAAVYCFKA